MKRKKDGTRKKIKKREKCSTTGLKSKVVVLMHQIESCIVTHQMYDFNCAVEKVDAYTKLCHSLLTQKFISYYTFEFVVGRKKQSIKTESPALAGQRKTTCHEEKESRDRPWISFWFCVVVLAYLFAGCVSTAARLVHDSFSELTPKWRSQISTIFTSSWLLFTLVFTSSCLRAM